MRNKSLPVENPDHTATYGGAECRLNFEEKNTARRNGKLKKSFAVIFAIVFLASGVLLIVAFRRSMIRLGNKTGGTVNITSVNIYETHAGD